MGAAHDPPTVEPITSYDRNAPAAGRVEEGKAGASDEKAAASETIDDSWLTHEVKVAGSCALFAVSSASMLLLNSCVARAYHLESTVTIIQMLFASATLSTLFFWALRFDNMRDVLTWSSIVPLLFSAMMVTSLIALRNASVGATNVVRNISPLLMLPIESCIQERVDVDVHTIFSLVIILTGIILYVHEDVHTSAFGLFMLVVNMVLAMSDRLVQRRYLAVRPLAISKTGMLLLNNSIGILWQIPTLFILNEPPKWEARFSQADAGNYVALVFSCIVGIAIGWTAINAQRFVSATTFMVLGNVSKVFVWIYGMLFLGEVRSPLAIAGAVTAIGGGFYYGYARIQLDAARRKAADPDKAKQVKATESSTLLRSKK